MTKTKKAARSDRLSLDLDCCPVIAGLDPAIHRS
jgi:hypothetical protein